MMSASKEDVRAGAQLWGNGGPVDFSSAQRGLAMGVDRVAAEQAGDLAVRVHHRIDTEVQAGAHRVFAHRVARIRQGRSPVNRAASTFAFEAVEMGDAEQSGCAREKQLAAAAEASERVRDDTADPHHQVGLGNASVDDDGQA